MVHELGYEDPRSIGTARVRKVVSYRRGETDRVELNLPIKAPLIDDSRDFHEVPRGRFQEGDIAEVIIKQFRGPPFLSDATAFIMEIGEFCRVAIRLSTPSTFGEDLDPKNPELQRMFEANIRNPWHSEGFYRRFLPEEFQAFVEVGPGYKRR